MVELMAEKRTKWMSDKLASLTGTSSVRVSADLAYMISHIGDILKIKQHALLDPLIRDHVETLFADIEDVVERTERIRDKFAAEQGRE